MADQLDDRSLRDLFAELTQETSVLVRKEMELAQTEMTAKAKAAGKDAGLVAAGGVLAHAGLLVLLAALVLTLGTLGMPFWLSAFIVAVATIAIGYVVARQGISKMRTTSFAPRHTIDTLKETATWKTRTRA